LRENASSAQRPEQQSSEIWHSTPTGAQLVASLASGGAVSAPASAPGV